VARVKTNPRLGQKELQKRKRLCGQPSVVNIRRQVKQINLVRTKIDGVSGASSDDMASSIIVCMQAPKDLPTAQVCRRRRLLCCPAARIGSVKVRPKARELPVVKQTLDIA
jgi:hypothetical protein